MASKIELTQTDIQYIKELLNNKSLPTEEKQLLDALVAIATRQPEKSRTAESRTEESGGDPSVAWIFDWSNLPK